MDIRDVDRSGFIGSSYPSPVYRVTYVGGDDTPEPYRNTEEQLDVSATSSVEELLHWVKDNAQGRAYQIAVKAWDVDPVTGTFEECLYELV